MRTYDNIADHGELAAPLIANVAAKSRAGRNSNATLNADVGEGARDVHRGENATDGVILV